MFSAGACSVSVGGKTRCLEALLGDKENARFVVGTTSLQQPNQIRVLHYDSAANDISVVQTYAHDAQVLALAPSPFAQELVVTCSKVVGQSATAALWRMDNISSDASASDNAPQPLAQLAELPPQKLPVTTVVWNPNDAAAPASLASAHGTALRTWRLDDSSTPSVVDKLELDLSLSPGSTIGAMRFDPHHATSVAFTLGGSVQTWDVRAKTIALRVDDAHAATTLDVDYNPNKPWCIATGGDDGQLKFWDLRRSHKPLLALAAHAHWVASVRYNRFHDQLVLSGSSDATLALWRVSSISSAPLVELDEMDFMSETAAGTDVADTKIQRYDEHEDSVYAVAWAAGDSWVFGSVSYDGRFCIHQVPSTEKYKILL